MSTADSLLEFGPELSLIATLAVVLVTDLLLRRSTDERRFKAVAAVALMGTSVGLIWAFGFNDREPVSIFSGMLALDTYALYFRLFFLVLGFFALVFAILSEEIDRTRFGEYALLLLTVVLGLTLLTAAHNLLMIYLALELVSLPSYILAGFRRDPDQRTSEASLKYVIFGGVASGFSLYGFSLLYGMAHTLDLAGLAEGLRQVPMTPIGLLTLGVAVVFSLAGFTYKVAAVPFHMWCPDVYEGAPTPFTAFLSIGPKAAGVAVLIRFLLTGLGDASGAAVPWDLIVAVLAAMTMTLGNLSALGQQNMKRLLAYSSIAHAGYMLMAVAVGSELAIHAIQLYLVFYLLMNLGAFLIVQAVRERTGSEDIQAFAELHRRSPPLALLMAVFLFSLIGVPPLAGFVGKFYLFASLLETGRRTFYVLAIIGLLNSVIALYYYARVLRAMFLEKANTAFEHQTVTMRRGTVVMLVVLAVPTLVLGMFWFPLADLLGNAAHLLR